MLQLLVIAACGHLQLAMFQQLIAKLPWLLPQLSLLSDKVDMCCAVMGSV